MKVRGSRNNPSADSTPAGRSFRDALAPVAALLLFAAALWMLARILRPYRLHDIQNAFHAISTGRIGLSLFLSALSYTVLGGYDALACRYLGKPLSYRQTALASFLSYTVAHNTGSLSIITSGGVRYRLYGGWGVAGAEIARIIGFCAVTFWLGFLFLAGLTLLFQPPLLPSPFAAVTPISLRLAGGICLLVAVGYLALALFRRRPFVVREVAIAMPSPWLAAGQIAVASADLLCVSGALYVLFPLAGKLSFAAFVGLYLMALVVGLLSNVPGGLGVFESVMLLLLGATVPGAEGLGALLVFRGMYYLLPLGLAAIILSVLELRRRRAGIARLTAGLHGVVSAMLPQILALATFVAGAILLFSGTLPAIGGRLRWISGLVPLPILELSHFLNSIIGSCLLVLAVGLRRRLDTAWLASFCLLAGGIVVSLVKGLDYEEAILLAILLLVLANSRDQFYRKASLWAGPISTGWITSILLVLAGACWLGLFVYRHQEYSSDLWWTFAVHGHAPRFLRAMVGAATTVLVFSLLGLSRPRQPPGAQPTKDELALAARIAGQSPDTRAYLALLGDKSLLFGTDNNAFLMYAVKGRSWVVMGDPVGAESGREELLWRFGDLCERYGGWPVFYEISGANLAQYVDLGLHILKIGEEGRVALPDFSLAGGSRKGLRYIQNRLVKEGYVSEIIPASAMEGLLPVLSDISARWLADKHAAEKGFSLGFFDPAYLRHFPVAVVRRGDRILAFATLWPGGGKYELSLDLMRYLPEAPPGVMDFLFIAIMLWGREQGYQWFSFGMAPLAGLDRQMVASLWSNIGAFVFRHGEHFYNFQGLREYKDKFDPTWEAKYIAYPQRFSLPAIFVNISSLISGGLKGLLVRG